jgi:hypothetical protein
LRQLNNFHSLFAVLAGLNLPPVQSLNRAFSEIPLQTQSVRHDNLCSSSLSFFVCFLFIFIIWFASFFGSHRNAVLQVFSDLVKLIPPREGEALAYKESLQKSVDEGHLPLLPYLGASIVVCRACRVRFPREKQALPQM